MFFNIQEYSRIFIFLYMNYLTTFYFSKFQVWALNLLLGRTSFSASFSGSAVRMPTSWRWKPKSKNKRGSGLPPPLSGRGSSPSSKRRRAGANGTEAGDEVGDGIKGESGDEARQVVKSSDEECASEVGPTLAKEEEYSDDEAPPWDQEP